MKNDCDLFSGWPEAGFLVKNMPLFFFCGAKNSLSGLLSD